MVRLRDMKRVMTEAAVESGKYAVTRAGKLNKKDIRFKGSFNNLVTKVDRICEEKIKSKIQKNFPEHGILAEESGGTEAMSGYLWVIDPIDGTTNFAHGFPVYCTSIGLMLDGQAIMGAVYDPSRDELFHAEKGKGAYLNKKRIKVSGVNKLSQSLVATGFAYRRDARISNIEHFKLMLKKTQAVRRPGAAAIDMCYVACGRLDAFWEFYLKPWDTSAGSIIVSEAGGKITKVDGNKYDIFEKDILVTNSALHRQILDSFKRIHS